MLEEKDYCDYKLVLELKELGYDYIRREGLIHLHDAQKWLREKKNIEVNATYDNVVELHWHWYMKSLTNRNQTTSIINYDSYEQALLAGIKVAVKILKEK